MTDIAAANRHAFAVFSTHALAGDEPLPELSADALCAALDLALTESGDELDGFFPEDEHRAAFVAVHAVDVARVIHGQCAGGVRPAFVALAPLEHVDHLEAHVTVRRYVRARLVA